MFIRYWRSVSSICWRKAFSAFLLASYFMLAFMTLFRCCTVEMQIVFPCLKLPVKIKLWVYANQQLFVCLSSHLSKVPFSNRLPQFVLQKLGKIYQTLKYGWWVLFCFVCFVLLLPLLWFQLVTWARMALCTWKHHICCVRLFKVL